MWIKSDSAETDSARLFLIRPFQVRIFLVQISPMLSGRIPAYVTLPVAMTEPIETDIKVSSRGDPN